jgi:hypothetical protein
MRLLRRHILWALRFERSHGIRQGTKSYGRDYKSRPALALRRVDKKSRILWNTGIVSLPARLTRRSSRPAPTFGVFILASPARAAERGRWA